MRRWLGMLGVLAPVVASTARADEPIGALQPDPMREGAELVTRTDASDPGDLISVNLVLGFVQTWKHANIRRESDASQPGVTSTLSESENIAQYNATTSSLLVGADVAIERAVTLALRVPIVLSFAQALDDLDGSSAFSAAQHLADPSGGALFGVPFESPTRSGVGYVSAGLNWTVYDQRRDRSKATWIVGIEGRLGIGAPIHACAQGASCPDPSNPSTSRDPGISRGTDVVVGKSVWSRRFGYVQPYAGVWVQAELPQPSSDFRRYAVAGESENPPVVASLGAGVQMIPYEDLQEEERLSTDLLLRGAYHSRGWDYSELFDALGSSQATSLRLPQPSGATGFSFTGISEEQAFAGLTLSASTTWQTGRYVRFTVGSAVSYVQPHLITGADPCPSGASSSACSSSEASPEFRDVIDRPGNRFSVDDSTLVDLWVMGVVIF